MRDNAATARAPALPGVIDSLGSGFSILNRALWVILLPIGLDLVLWLAPRLSIGPLVDRLSETYRTTLSQAASTAPPDAVTAQSLDQASALVETMRTTAQEFNLFSLLTTNVANAVVPSLGGALHAPGDRVLDVAGLGSFVAIAVALQAVGTLLGCLYLVLIAHVVTGQRLSLPTVLRRAGRAWLNTVAYALLVLGALLAVSIPLGILVTVLSMVAPVVAGFFYALIFTFAWILGVWMLLYLYFVAAGIVLGGLGPIKAIVGSVGLVRRNFWSSLGLVLLTLLISLGMGVIWEQLTQQSWGFGVAIVGNAYVASGLGAAGLFFYWHRSGLAGLAARPSAPTS